MSVIAAVHDHGSGRTWLGSDTGVCVGNLRHLAGPKWIIRKPWAIGVAGHERALNVIEHRADRALKNPTGPFDLASRLRALLKSDGFHENTDEPGPAAFGQTMMLAHPLGVWIVGSEFSVVSVPAGQVWAEGSGRELAIGAARALCTSAKADRQPFENILTRAIEVAIALDVSCGGTPWIAQLAGRRRG